MPVIWVERKPKYFCDRDWTGRIALIRFEKFGCRRRCCSPDERSDIRENERLYPRVSLRSPGLRTEMRRNECLQINRATIGIFRNMIVSVQLTASVPTNTRAALTPA